MVLLHLPCPLIVFFSITLYAVTLYAPSATYSSLVCLYCTVLDKATSQGLSPDKAALKVLESIALRERERTLASPMHHAALYLKLLSPSLLDWMLRKRAKSD